MVQQAEKAAAHAILSGVDAGSQAASQSINIVPDIEHIQARL
jgi:hypothetical protein